MTKKFLISLLFLIAFILLLSASDKVSALTFTYKDKEICFDNYKLFAYNIITIAPGGGGINLTSTEEPFVLKTASSGRFINLNCMATSVTYYDDDRFYVSYENKLSDISGGFDLKKILYIDYDLCTSDGTVVIPDTTVSHDTFFNFRHGTLDYSINLTCIDNNIVLGEYIAIFKVNSILFIYTTDEHPTYKYNNYKHYLSTKSSTRTYGYDLKTDKVILEDTLTKYSPNGLDIPFDKSQLIYSNFLLMDKINNLIFGTAGRYLGEDDMKGTASGNIASGGQSSEGNSLLNDYINSQNPNYNGSSNQGSDTISGGFNNVYNNFGFAEDVKKNVNGMVDVITNTEEAPKFQLNVNSKYYKGTLTIVDLSWYAPYKEMGDNVICIFAYLGFLWRIFIRLPDIIRGAGASSYAPNMLGDIETFRKTGFGRSSSPRDKTF